jgi:putative PIN family toxin of toxin-antitoxin system
MRRSRRRRVRAVVDTNICVSGLIIKRGNPFDVLEALRSEDFNLVMSPSLWSELTETLGRSWIPAKYDVTSDEILSLIEIAGQNVLMVEPERFLPLHSRDPRDDKFLAGRAHYLVTGDKDLLVLRDDPTLGNIHLVTPAEFLSALNA